MPLYDLVARLPLVIEAVAHEPRSVSVRGGRFTRATTTVVLRGGGVEGVGEDVTYDGEAHATFQARLDEGSLPLVGEWASLDDFSRALDDIELFPEAPGMPAFQDYRRWALESAALDLALRQANRSLADAVKRAPRPVTFVVSMGLGDPPSIDPLRRLLDADASLRFKLDATSAWPDGLFTEVAATDAVDVVDLKGAYRGTPVDQDADPRLYRLVAESFPNAWIEDPNLDADDAAAVLEQHRDRITWDAPIHSAEDVDALPFAPRTINIKPSRFGSVRRLLAAYEYCESHGIGMYGGGQFELGPGRGQIQYLASLFHPDTPNDVAPPAFNLGELENLPTSPLPRRRGRCRLPLGIVRHASDTVASPTRHHFRSTVHGMATTKQRKAETPWGAAALVEEVTLPQRAGDKRFSTIVQLLETDRGERFVRFAYATTGTARRGPVTLRARDLDRLREALAEHPALAAALGLGGGA